MSIVEINPPERLAEPAIDAPGAGGILSSERAVVWGVWISWVLACLPLLFVRVLPAVDYPDHLARIFILARGLSLPGYTQYYHPNWALLPNLAFDLVMVPLAKIMPVTLAGRLFVAGVFALTAFGGARLNKALVGRWTWLSLVPSLLLYNRILAYGFINFLEGVGLLLLALAIHIEQRKSPAWKRTLIDSVFLLGLFASHLVALALYVFCALAYDLSVWIAERPGRREILTDLAVLLAPCVVILGVFVGLSPTTGEASQTEFRGLGQKLRLLHITLQTGQGAWDVIFAVLVVAFVAWLFWKRQVRLAPRMVLPLIAFLGLFIATPTGFKQAMNVDTRIPLVLTLVAFAALRPDKRFNATVVGSCLLGLLVFRAATTAVHYRAWQAKTNAILADLRNVPADSILLVTRHEDSHAFDAVAWNPPLMHLADLLLLERPFLAEDLFTIPTQQPLLKNAPYDRVDLTAKVGGAYARNMRDFGREAAAQQLALGMQNRPEYIYYVKRPGEESIPPELTPVVVRTGYAIYKVNPDVLKTDQDFNLPTVAVEKDHIVGEIERWNASN